MDCINALMKLKDYFRPVNLNSISNSAPFHRGSWASNIAHSSQLNSQHSIEKYQIALIGLTDERNTANKGCKDGALAIRQALYRLAAPSNNMKIIDLGDLIEGKTANDTYFALSYVCATLKKANVIPILLGADQDQTLGVVKGFVNDQEKLNLVSIDSKIDWDIDYESFNAQNYLSEIVNQHEDSIWEITVLGHQSYLTEQERYHAFSKKHFDDIRLGELRGKIYKAEPVYRDAHIVSFDISAVRYCDSPGHINANPNGLYAEEFCQLARYAGLSSKISAAVFSGLNPKFDNRSVSAQLTAQAIWYFIDGLQHRINDHSTVPSSDHKRYSVVIEDIDFPLTFYKSLQTERWWMEINWKNSSKDKVIVACTEDDYRIACNNEVPETWWRNFKKGSNL
ncbi:hypothetical protein EMN47_06990 [Prolixibacteraceae bacterium JC049]|nr:hypothetical protein [Prolixibacteraceae bacterium JC049]